MMDTAIHNEAEEYLRTCLAGTYREKKLDEALAATRRATVARIRSAFDAKLRELEGPCDGSHRYCNADAVLMPDDIYAILDAEQGQHHEHVFERAWDGKGYVATPCPYCGIKQEETDDA